MNKQELKDRILRTEDLPTLPSVAVKIISTVLDETSTAKDVAEVLEADNALTMRLLKASNSAFYGIPRTVSTVKDAIVVLGFTKLKGIILSLSVMDTIEAMVEESGLDVGRFWQHGLMCAICAEDLARKVDTECAEEIFVAGLVHDIGKLLLAQHAPLQFRQSVEMAQANGISQDQAERATIDIDHAQVGRWIMDQWQFPVQLMESVWLHHHPPLEKVSEDASCKMAAVICLADIIANTQGGRVGDLDQMDEIRKTLGLTEKEVDNISRKLRDRVAEITSVLGLEKFSGDAQPELVQNANAELGKMNLQLDHQKDRLQKEEAEKTMLYQIASQLLRCSRLEDILESVGQEIIKSIGFQRIIARLKLDNGSTLIAEAYPTGDGRIMRRSRTVGPEEKQTDPSGDLVECGRTEIVVAGRAVGSISAWRNVQEMASGRETEILGVVASLTALAVERTDVHQHSQDRAEMLAMAHAELKKAHDDLRDAQQRMVHLEALARLGEMVAMVAHDVRTPLTGIMGYATLLNRDLGTDPKSSRMVSKIISETERLDRMITDLLVLAKPLEPELKNVDIKHPVNNALSLIKAELNGNGRSFNIKTVFPERQVELRADPDLLEEAFLNLFKNAIQAMPNGGELKVETCLECGPGRNGNGAASGDRQLRIRISDTGVGIPSEIRGKLFEPFVTTKEKGMGVGLTMVDRIVDVHQGKIGVESQPGRGTTFSIALPVPANGTPTSAHNRNGTPLPFPLVATG